MKGALASTLDSLKALRDNKISLPGKLTWVLLSNGEHGDQNGAQALANRGILKNLGGDMILYTESTGNNIIRSFKGRIFFEVKVKGRSVHVSVPEKGINAIEKWAGSSKLSRPIGSLPRHIPSSDPAPSHFPPFRAARR